MSDDAPLSKGGDNDDRFSALERFSLPCLHAEAGAVPDCDTRRRARRCLGAAEGAAAPRAVRKGVLKVRIWDRIFSAAAGALQCSAVLVNVD